MFETTPVRPILACQLVLAYNFLLALLWLHIIVFTIPASYRRGAPLRSFPHDVLLARLFLCIKVGSMDPREK